MQIKNSVFLVTGGASGLGAATARMAAENGGKVVIADMQADAGEKFAKEIGARFVKTDVTSEADGLQVLVNCAGIALAERTLGKEAPHDLGRFTRVINVNLIGTFNMIRLAADAMAKAGPNAAGERGVIVNTASVAAFDGQIGQAAYSASKGGVVAMTLPVAAGPAGRIRAAGEGDHRDRDAQRGDDPPGRRHPHGAQVITAPANSACRPSSAPRSPWRRREGNPCLPESGYARSCPASRAPARRREFPSPR